MQFNSYYFLLFFPVVLFIYFFIPAKLRYVWLLISSYYFYMSWNPQYAILILSSTIVTYSCGIVLDKANGLEDENEKKKVKKRCIVIALVINLFILFIFKYTGFALDTINSVLNKVQRPMIEMPFDIILPIGISFYTFQALGYIIDLYRGDVPAEKNFVRYALFVSFFPQLAAGPIGRSNSLLPQFRNMDKIKVWDTKRITSGLILMLWGYFQKMVIADRLAILVDYVYTNHESHGASAFVLATFFFTIQIYCDFSSYTNIAIGASEIMGITLMKNFNTPYFATSISDFWRRWHISLSSWFKDYVYIPLGGNRCSRGRKYINIMIVFLLSGLWHGAAWHFVIWGGLHGLYQIAGNLLMPVRKWCVKCFKVDTEAKSYRIGQMIITFIFVDFAWIFFKVESVGEAMGMLKNAIKNIDPWCLFDGSLYTWGLDKVEFWIAMAAIAVLFIIDSMKMMKKDGLRNIFLKQNTWFRWIIYIGAIGAIFLFGVYGPMYSAQDFIYFQF